MAGAGEVFNIVLALCAVAYSFLPPHRVRRHNRRLSLFLRLCGLLLLSISLTSLFLTRLPR